MKRAVHDTLSNYEGSKSEFADGLLLPGLSSSEDLVTMRQQLAREISCLEGQLYRLKTRSEILDVATLHTYEEMLVSRKQLLETL